MVRHETWSLGSSALPPSFSSLGLLLLHSYRILVTDPPVSADRQLALTLLALRLL